MKYKYSLEKLAWLSRCLFPDDFMDELMEMGVNKPEAFFLSRMLHKPCGCTRNILELYQELIGSKHHTDLIEQYCIRWFAKE